MKMEVWQLKGDSLQCIGTIWVDEISDDWKQARFTKKRAATPILHTLEGVHVVEPNVVLNLHRIGHGNKSPTPPYMAVDAGNLTLFQLLEIETFNPDISKLVPVNPICACNVCTPINGRFN